MASITGNKMRVEFDDGDDWQGPTRKNAKMWRYAQASSSEQEEEEEEEEAGPPPPPKKKRKRAKKKTKGEEAAQPSVTLAVENEPEPQQVQRATAPPIAASGALPRSAPHWAGLARGRCAPWGPSERAGGLRAGGRPRPQRLGRAEDHGEAARAALSQRGGAEQ